MTIAQNAFYLPVADGECFCLYRRPERRDPTRTILHLPAFGDEMNKARAMTARSSRVFAAHGFGVLQIDLYGCGDSSGEHEDATLSRWVGNALRAIEWLRAQSPRGTSPWLWALRAGALLIPPLIEQAVPDAPLLLWQPLLSGLQQLNQLLRQKVAGELLDSARERSGVRALRERLINGEAMEIGGYAISPVLARELEQAVFEIPAMCRGPIEWFEVSGSATPALSPLVRTKIDALRSIGSNVFAHALQGSGFWQSTEIEVCDSLINASLEAITGRMHGLSRDAVVL